MSSRLSASSIPLCLLLQEPDREHQTPRVSPYRLAAHLASAFTIYALLAWTTLSLAFPLSPAAAAELSPAAAGALGALRARAHPLAALIGLTALSGALPAGGRTRLVCAWCRAQVAVRLMVLATLHASRHSSDSVALLQPWSQHVRSGMLLAGAFVAGNDAGHAYNSFPKMNGQWLPDEYFELPGWRNAFESTAAVQLHHRCAPC